MNRIPSTLAGAAAVLVVAALGSSALGAADLYIHQHNLHFSESKVAVKVGDRLTFTNDDDVIHNIGVRGGADDETEDLGLQKPRIAVSHRFNEPGAFVVVCSIHPRMRLKVSVSR
jgi:plastocyanin